MHINIELISYLVHPYNVRVPDKFHGSDFSFYLHNTGM